MSSSTARSSSSRPRSFSVIATSLASVAITVLVGPGTAQSAVITVGPHGSHATIQGALGGVVSGSVNELRIESGTYLENVVVESPTVSFTSGELHLSGGWNSTFTVQTSNPSLTTIDGTFGGSCIRLHPSLSAAATITVSNLTVTHGLAQKGGGISFQSSTNVTIFRLTGVSFTQNLAQGLGSTETGGGGLYAELSGSNSQVRLTRCSFVGNSAEAFSDGSCTGGGAYIALYGNNNAAGIELSSFESNTLAGGPFALGAGLYMGGSNQNIVWIIASDFTSNEVLTGSPVYGTGAGFLAQFVGGSVLMLREINLLGNICPLVDAYQADVIVSGTTSMSAGDILATGGNTGVRFEARDTASASLTNLTVTDNVGIGLRFYAADPTVTATMQNTLLYGNGTNLSVSGSLAGDHNLIGVNPHFADPAGGDYHLTAGSPAENAGTNNPTAGLGNSASDGGIRLIDGVVDIGALEGVDVLFSDGVSWGVTDRWDSTAGATDGPVPR